MSKSEAIRMMTTATLLQLIEDCSRVAGGCGSTRDPRWQRMSEYLTVAYDEMAIRTSPEAIKHG